MATKEAIRGTVRGPREVELEKELDIPVGSEISITIATGWNVSNLGVTNTFSVSTVDSVARFKHAAGSWKDVPESFIKEVYDNRHISSRNDVVL